jgi:hypothetical protein
MTKFLREGFKLTAQAESDAADYIANYEGCSCHITAPCSSCVHPGNPINIEYREDCWEIDPAWTLAGNVAESLINNVRYYF